MESDEVGPDSSCTVLDSITADASEGYINTSRCVAPALGLSVQQSWSNQFRLSLLFPSVFLAFFLSIYLSIFLSLGLKFLQAPSVLIKLDLTASSMGFEFHDTQRRRPDKSRWIGTMEWTLNQLDRVRIRWNFGGI